MAQTNLKRVRITLQLYTTIHAISDHFSDMVMVTELGKGDILGCRIWRNQKRSLATEIEKFTFISNCLSLFSLNEVATGEIYFSHKQQCI